MQRLAGFLLVVTLFAVGWWSVLPHPAIAQPAAPADSVKRDAAVLLQLQGVASCAATGCHHGNGVRGTKGSEYTTWVVHDRHAQAFQSLLSDRSRLIERNFKKLADLQESHPEKSALCLHCHVQPQVTKLPRGPRFSFQDGVGCESCHGPAQKWLEPHVTWKGLSPAEKKRAYEEHGMIALADLGQRAQVCASCHIGSADADVNHDLIAAGHPRLRFEYSAYLGLMPKHAPADSDLKRHADFEARAWAVGQVVCARSALELLASRAQPSLKPWPEFAEYDCFACHHDLGRPSRRQQPGLGGRTPGALPWGNWYYAMLPTVFALQPTEDSSPARSALIALKQEMQKPLPDSAMVSTQARNAIGQMNLWLTRVNQGKYDDPAALRRILNSMQTEEKQAALYWDSEAQRYLGMAALDRALRDREPKQPETRYRKYLQRLGSQLQFPNGYDGPPELKQP